MSSKPLAAQPDLTDTHNPDPDPRSRPLKTLTVISGLKGGPQVWRGGSIYNPGDGKAYRASISTVDANTLKLTGCIAAPLRVTQTWTRLR